MSRWSRYLLAVLLVLPGSLALAADPPWPARAEPGDLAINIGSRTTLAERGPGWSHTERGRDGRNYRWVKTLETDLWFHLDAAVDTDLWLTASPFYLNYRQQNIGLYLNGHFVTEWLCPDSADFTDYYVLLPASAIREGRNRLILRMGYTHRAPGEERMLSLAVDGLLLRQRNP